MTSSVCKNCREKIHMVKIAHGSAAIAIYIQGLFWLTFSLQTTPRTCGNMTSPCSDYPRELCGAECPTFIIFLVLIFGNMLASFPGIIGSVQNENTANKDNFSSDSRLALRCYSVAGIITTAIELHYLNPIFALVTGLLYIYAITVTRELWWRKPAQEPDVTI